MSIPLGGRGRRGGHGRVAGPRRRGACGVGRTPVRDLLGWLRRRPAPEHRSTGGPAAGIESEQRAGVWAGHGALSQSSPFGRVLVPADDLAAYPRAGWVGRRAVALLQSGVVARPDSVALDTHGSDEGATARSLDGAALLPPRPLYLRRPDAMTPGGAP